MFILLLLYANITFSIVVESQEDCALIVKANIPYWEATGQRPPEAVCMKTDEV